MVKGAYSLTCAFFTRSIYSIFLSTQVLDIELLCSRSLSEKKTNAVDPGNSYNGVNNPAAQCVHATENTGHKIKPEKTDGQPVYCSYNHKQDCQPVNRCSHTDNSFNHRVRGFCFIEPAALIGSCT